MKTYLLLFLCAVSLSLSARVHSFGLENTTNSSCSHAVVVLSAQQFEGGLPSGYPLARLNGKPVAVQSDDLNNDGKPDELALMVDLKPLQKATLSLRFVAKVPSKPVFRKNVRVGLFVQKDGKWAAASDQVLSREVTVWQGGLWFENECLLGRLTPDRRYSLEWKVKTDPGLCLPLSPDSLETVAPLALDGVQPTLVAWSGTKLQDIDPVTTRTVRVLASGPVRVVVEMGADRWKVRNQSINLRTRLILYAGRRDVELIHYLEATDLTALTLGVPFRSPYDRQAWRLPDLATTDTTLTLNRTLLCRFKGSPVVRCRLYPFDASKGQALPDAKAVAEDVIRVRPRR
jgi:hypothetical protein